MSATPVQSAPGGHVVEDEAAGGGLAQAFVTLPVAADFLGIGRSTAYRLATAGTFPVPVRRIGCSWRVSRAALERFAAEAST